MLIFFITLIIVGVIFGSVITFVEYGVHIDMVKDLVKYGRASYETFVKEFEKHNWIQDNIFKESLFDYPTNSKIHASIIQFDGVGMIMKSSIDYWKMRWYLRQYLKSKNIFKEYIWE